MHFLHYSRYRPPLIISKIICNLKFKSTTCRKKTSVFLSRSGWRFLTQRKIFQLFIDLSAHIICTGLLNAFVERVFSLINIQWTKSQNTLKNNEKFNPLLSSIMTKQPTVPWNSVKKPKIVKKKLVVGKNIRVNCYFA